MCAPFVGQYLYVANFVVNIATIIQLFSQVSRNPTMIASDIQKVINVLVSGILGFLPSILLGRGD
jgi:FtsH-binding integral membrane protein